MAAPGEQDEFDRWLSEKLQKINEDVDLDVFVTYIRGVLETDTDDEDKDESIAGILGEITEDGMDLHCCEIRKKWTELDKAMADEKQKKEAQNIEQQLVSMMGKANVAVIKQKELTDEERARKQAILAQYAQMSDGEASDEEGASGGLSGAAVDLAKNDNAESVTAREREIRERSKQESEQKKQKDKEDREKQKQKASDRKEKEKARTQKGERRR